MSEAKVQIPSASTSRMARRNLMRKLQLAVVVRPGTLFR
jgi:hypothetical protein